MVANATRGRAGPRSRFPDANGPALAMKTRLTNSPDEHFILDHHPDHREVALAAGFGHGFKFCSVVGDHGPARARRRFATRHRHVHVGRFEGPWVWVPEVPCVPGEAANLRHSAQASEPGECGGCRLNSSNLNEKIGPICRSRCSTKPRDRCAGRRTVRTPHAVERRDC